MPADISVDFVVHELKGYKLVLIQEPTQAHVVAWERASRALKNQEAKPLLTRMMAEMNKVKVDSDAGFVMNVFRICFETLSDVIKVLDQNETLTLSANAGVMVKAAIMSKWIVVPDLKVEHVDKMKPWLVHWIAEKVGSLYLEVTTIPKN